MSDLETQLRASLPGRETAVQDYARLHVARELLQQAIKQVTAARGCIVVALGNDRAAAVLADSADLEMRKAVLDIDRAIKAHPAGRVPK